jgi:phytoene dehydrogenase-like protein
LSKSLERTYDGIIVGAGHHGLTLGTYLARARLDILLVERRLTYGGGLCTREVTLTGFYHNLHSINHFYISETPWFRDLNLDERVTYITLRYEFGLGATFTEIERKTVTPAQKERMAMQCVPRAEVPEDLVGAVLFLASEASAFVTGQSINLDGGVTGS